MLVSLLLFPVTLYYFSPVIIIEGAFQGIVTGSFVMFGLQFVASLFLGRAFCGWLCPAAGLQEACFRINGKRAGRGRWAKYVIWVPWMATIAAAVWTAGGLKSIDPLYQTQGGISVTEPVGYVVLYGFAGLMVVLALTAGKRAFCHYVCWMAPFMVAGSKIRQRLGLPALRLQAKADNCTRCGRCTRNCPMSLDVQSMVQSGAVLGHPDCILCGECVDGCTQGAVRYSFGRRARPARA